MIAPFRSLVLLFMIGLAVCSCQDDLEFVRGDSVELRFSVDTVMFDTVFTARGSATQILKVYNDANENVSIDRVRVAGQTGVTYNFNVDGTQGPEARDVVIFAEDSIFVFVEATVDPTEPEEVSPFIAEDRLLFETGGRTSDVRLIAFGQNANYLNDFRRGEFISLSCEGGTFTLPDDLPTVIFGSLFVDDCTLEALAGTRIYFHGGVQRNQEVFEGSGFFNDGFIFTLEQGRLAFRGTAEEPVILSTDRLEERFRDDPGKYRGLILGPGSRGNVLEHTQVLNSIVGVTLDSAAELTLENSVIAYSNGAAISAFLADVTVRNSLFHSNFGNAIQFILGGSLTMDHTTVANYGVDASALVLTNFDCDEEDNCLGAQMRARVRNSILVGSRDNELILADIFGGDEPDLFDVRFANSVVRTNNEFLRSQEGLFADFYERLCSDCLNLSFDDPLFQSIQADDYRLDSLSVARGLGDFIPSLDTDIRGIQRVADSTDAGAFQFVPGEE